MKERTKKCQGKAPEVKRESKDSDWYPSTKFVLTKENGDLEEILLIEREKSTPSMFPRMKFTFTLKPAQSMDGNILLFSCIWPLYNPSGIALWVSSGGLDGSESTRLRGRFGNPSDMSVCNVRVSRMPGFGGRSGRGLSLRGGKFRRLSDSADV